MKYDEKIKIEYVKIPKWMSKPRQSKLNDKRRYLKKHGYFKETIILDDDDYLIDGYTSYILALEKGLKKIHIRRKM